MSLARTFLGTIWAEFAVCTSLMGLRTASCYLTKSYRLDFWLALMTYILSLCANIFCTISVYYGAGKHMPDLDPDAVKGTIMWQWIVYQTFVVSHMIVKLAIIAFLLEIERTLPLARKYLLYIVGAVNLGFGAAIDIFLTVYPMVVFWQLQMKLRLKIGLCVLFSFGLVTAACAIVKTIGIGVLDEKDATYQLATLDIYSLTEMWIVLIVGCVPPTRQLSCRILRRARAISTSETSNGTGARRTKRGYASQMNPSRSGPESNHRADVTTKHPTLSDSQENILVPNSIMMARTFNLDQRDTKNSDRDDW